tara:strand:+ start:150 stop:1295 length:1146 start_codon:yes stop_codon:yes gene_type:complete
MAKKWDYDVPEVELWKEVYRVLKPGGHLLSFAGSRTYHRMAVNIEDAGFEIRDMLGWLYGSGFPKSHNIGKAVDKLEGNKREVIGTENIDIGMQGGSMHSGRSTKIVQRDKTKGNSEWEGWGTALKPAHEPIVMARKPFKGTVAENVLTHGTGGINIDECRVGTELIKTHGKGTMKGNTPIVPQNPDYEGKTHTGRFPANIIHDGSEEVLEIFPETNPSKRHYRTSPKNKNVCYGVYNENNTIRGHNDEGTAARFFYCAKASKAERNMGLDDFKEEFKAAADFRPNHKEKALEGESGNPFGRWGKIKNNHPTVKPIKLMEYLVRLVTPKEGIVLEPFAGSGTTLIACKQQGFNYIGIEREQEYCDIAEARLKGVQIQGTLF